MPKKQWQDLMNALIGMWVIVSPFFLATKSQRVAGMPSWSLWVTGALVVAFTIVTRS
jgi:membrane protein YdbS with pleckstrin-like domain